MALTTVDTGTITDSAVTAAKIASDAVTTVKILDANVTTAKIANDAVDYTKLATGTVIQVVNAPFSGVSSTTTVIPSDDTIPQITEGGEFMTSAFTPKVATSNLRIDVVMNLSPSVGSGVAGALFQDSTADALAAGWSYTASNATPVQVCFTAYVTASGTTARTYRVRGGMTGVGTCTFNGAAAARYFGGVMSSSITITEVKA